MKDTIRAAGKNASDEDVRNKVRARWEGATKRNISDDELDEIINAVKENRYLQKATGGLVEGPEVPFTKEDPADRVDPFTGLPYQEQMDRLGFRNE